MDLIKIRQISKLKPLDKVVIIEGLPGIGNVGKITVDFIIEKIKAKKVYEIDSNSFPNCVFVNENNLVELPKIEIFHKKIKNNDLFLVSGDVQPTDEKTCYEFCDKVLDLFEGGKAKEIVTVGGIGMDEAPKKPKIFCTGNNKNLIKKYKLDHVKTNVANFIGPIMGVSGLLLGLAEKRNIPAISLLAETYYHPTHLGMKGAKEIIKILNKKLSLNLSLKQLDKDVSFIEKNIVEKVEEAEVKEENLKTRDIDYIG